MGNTHEQSIAGARARLVDGDRSGALAELIAVWRRCPAAGLAVAIEQLSSSLAAPHEPVPGSSAEARQAAWLALASKDDASVVDRLIGSIEERRSNLFRERLEQLKTRMPDPRIGRMLVRWLERPPFADEWFADELASTLPRSGDPRVLATLERMQQAGWIARATQALRQTLPDVIELDESETAALAEVRRLIGPPPLGAALLKAIYENPDDDGLRLVYADWLLEQRDPLGEFIALQYGKGDAARERALLDEHGTRWQGRRQLRPRLRRMVDGARGLCPRQRRAAAADHARAQAHGDGGLVGEPALLREAGAPRRGGGLPVLD